MNAVDRAILGLLSPGARSTLAALDIAELRAGAG
jgi:hypothetical protein